MATFSPHWLMIKSNRNPNTKHWSGNFNIPVGQIQGLLRGQPVVDGLRVGDLAPVLGLLAVTEVHDGRKLADPELPRLKGHTHMTFALDGVKIKQTKREGCCIN